MPTGRRKESDSVQRLASEALRLDDRDRTLLAALAEDAMRSYAELGALLHLSAAAVHERVKRLRAEGVIKGTSARLDGPKIGRPLLAFVQVDGAGWTKERQVATLRDLPEVEEIHSVAGDASTLLKVRTRDAVALEDLLRRIYAVEGVQGTRTQVVLSTALERGPSP